MRLNVKVLLVFGVLISFSLFGAKVNKSRFSINSSMSFAGYKFLAKNNPVIKLSYQNTSRARFELFKINDIKKIVSQKRYYGNYVSLNIYKDKSIKKKRIKKWTKKLKNKNEYQIDNLKLNKLKPGVYLLYAKSKENIESAAIINISDNVLIVKRVKSKILDRKSVV